MSTFGGGEKYLSLMRKKLAKDMGRGIPMYIQSIYTSTRRKKIVINVDEKKKQEAKQFVKKRCPGIYERDIIIFWGQKRPNHSTDQEGQFAAGASFDLRQNNKYFEPGAKVIGVAEEIYDNLISKAPNITQFNEFKEWNVTGLEYGSIGGLLYDKTSGLVYGTTANHTLEKLSTPGTERKKYVLVELFSMEDNQEIDKIEVLSPVYFGIHKAVCFNIDDGNETESKNTTENTDNENEPHYGIDIAVFRLKESLLKSMHNKMFKKGFNVDTCQKIVGKDASPLIGNEIGQVSKSGASTGTTDGEVILEDMECNVAGELCQGSFIVVKNKGDSEFAAVGDSGSWVSNKAKMSVYGYVHMVQRDYYDDNRMETYKYITWCLRMDKAIDALNSNKKWAFNLDICKYDDMIAYIENEESSSNVDSGYATTSLNSGEKDANENKNGKQFIKTKTKGESMKMPLEDLTVSDDDVSENKLESDTEISYADENFSVLSDTFSETNVATRSDSSLL